MNDLDQIELCEEITDLEAERTHTPRTRLTELQHLRRQLRNMGDCMAELMDDNESLENMLELQQELIAQADAEAIKVAHLKDDLEQMRSATLRVLREGDDFITTGLQAQHKGKTIVLVDHVERTLREMRKLEQKVRGKPSFEDRANNTHWN